MESRFMDEHTSRLASDARREGAGASPVRFGPRDVDALVALEQLCFSYPWTAEQFKLGLEREVFRIFGIKRGEEIVAYLSFYLIGQEMEILNLAVRPECRRRGLGRRLLGLVLQSCYTLGVRESLLEVRRSNQAALRLYRSYGYEDVGVRKAYYPDNNEDALLLKCDLGRLFAR
jgi:ribosomal-protein-alanine N-acetyltransferase